MLDHAKHDARWAKKLHVKIILFLLIVSRPCIAITVKYSKRGQLTEMCVVKWNIYTKAVCSDALFVNIALNKGINMIIC